MTQSTLAGYDQDRLQTVRAREDANFRSRIPRSSNLVSRARRSMPNGVPMALMAWLYRHPPLFVDEGSSADYVAYSTLIAYVLNHLIVITYCNC